MIAPGTSPSPPPRTGIATRVAAWLREPTVIALVVLAVATRLLPHPPNLTAVGAVGLFAGACLRPAHAFTATGAAMLLTDLLLGLYHPVAMLGVYAGMLAGVPLGRALLRARRGVARQAAAATAGALVFFLLSNLGTWLAGELYPRTLHGLAQCYLLALPFLAPTLLGNLLYLPLLFALRDLARGSARTLLSRA